MNESTQKLVAALEEQNDPRLRKLIKRAKREEFHDYDSPHAMPNTLLVVELVGRGHEAFAQRVANGEFDATEAEAAKWRNTFEGMEAFDDPQAIAKVKEILMAQTAAMGETWDEKAWEEWLSSNRLAEG